MWPSVPVVGIKPCRTSRNYSVRNPFRSNAVAVCRSLTKEITTNAKIASANSLNDQTIKRLLANDGILAAKVTTSRIRFKYGAVDGRSARSTTESIHCGASKTTNATTLHAAFAFVDSLGSRIAQASPACRHARIQE